MQLSLFTLPHHCTHVPMTTKLEKTLYTRVTENDFKILTQLADQRQQSISQLIRKTLIDSGVLSR